MANVDWSNNIKIAFIIIFTLIFTTIGVFFVLGLISQSGEANGLVQGKLTRCPDKPNCMCTEYVTDSTHYISPLVFSETSHSKALSRLKNSVRELGGSIQEESENYLAATFTSSIFRFVDDLEFRVDTEHEIIHIRSASRAGYSDGGINQKRIEQIKKLFQIRE